MTSWRKIPGHPNYEAGNRGDIRRISTKHVLQPNVWRTGYLQVSLWDGGVGITCKVHRLVCAAFHGSPPRTKTDTAHRNGNKADNRPSNLRWATRAENERDKLDHGLSNRGSRNGQAVLTEREVRKIRELVLWLPTSSGGCRIKKGALPALAAEYGVTAGCLRQMISGKYWSHVT